jgi:lysophospholipase L1-like esterase
MTVDPGDAPSTVRLGEPAECGAAGASLRPSAQVHWLSGVQVDSAAVRSVAAFGDSITEGIGLVPGRYQRWTDRVAAGGTAIVNGGVSGGALTRTGVPASVPGLTRLPALLAQPGLTDVVLEMGINDLGAGVSASALLVGYERALAQVTARGLTPWVATVTPRIGSPWSAAREQQRRTINALLRSGWLSSRGGNLIDLDAALRDPREPDRLAPAYDSGDHLHPNSAGALRIAGTVAGALRLPPPR